MTMAARILLYNYTANTPTHCQIPIKINITTKKFNNCLFVVCFLGACFYSFTLYSVIIDF